MPEVRFYIKKEDDSQKRALITAKYFCKPRIFSMSTGVKILPRDWNPTKQRARKTATGSSDINAILDRIEDSIHAAVLKLKAGKKPVSPESIRGVLEGENLTSEPGKDVVEYIIANFKNKVTYSNLAHQIQAFTRRTRRGRSFEDIDTRWYRDFEKFLLSQELANSYAARLLTALKSTVKCAVMDRVTLHNEIFGMRSGISSETSGKMPLTFDEVNAFYRYDPGEPHLVEIRDCLVAACLTGLRYSDWSKLLLSNMVTIGRREFIEVFTQKTATFVHIPLIGPTKSILEKYGGRLPVQDKHRTNRYLKIMAQKAGFVSSVQRIDRRGGTAGLITKDRWTLFSTHVGRVTFNSACRGVGMPDHLIQELTGHKGRQRTMTDHYDRRNFEAKAEAMEPYLRKMEMSFPGDDIPLKWLSDDPFRLI